MGVATDLDSRNGTYLNGSRLPPGRRPLHPGDVVRCGDTPRAVAGTSPPGPVLSALDDTRTADS